MFKQRLKIGIVAAFFAVSTSYAVEPLHAINELPELSAEPQQVTASKRIAAYFSRYHYGRAELNTAMGQQIFDRYFEQLDYNRMFMLQQDIDAFNQHRDSFHLAISEGKLDVAYDIYELHLERRFQRYQHALQLLDNEFAFDNEGERFYYDRSEQPWAKDTAELNAIWEQRVRNDALNLALAGRNNDEIKENLERRYQTALQRLTQTNNEDVFQTVMSAFGRSVDAHTSYLSPRNA